MVSLVFIYGKPDYETMSYRCKAYGAESANHFAKYKVYSQKKSAVLSGDEAYSPLMHLFIHLTRQTDTGELNFKVPVPRSQLLRNLNLSYAKSSSLFYRALFSLDLSDGILSFMVSYSISFYQVATIEKISPTRKLENSDK